MGDHKYIKRTSKIEKMNTENLLKIEKLIPQNSLNLMENNLEIDSMKNNGSYYNLSKDNF